MKTTDQKKARLRYLRKRVTSVNVSINRMKAKLVKIRGEMRNIEKQLNE